MLGLPNFQLPADGVPPRLQVNLAMPPKLPLGGIYRPWITVWPGSPDSQPITRSIVSLDVNNHLVPPTVGSLVMNQTGQFAGQVVMNLTELLASSAAQSWHNMAIQGKTHDGNTTATNTGSLAVFFEVVNGEPARCGVPIQTHAASDVGLTVKNTTARKALQPSVDVARDTNGEEINLKCVASGVLPEANGCLLNYFFRWPLLPCRPPSQKDSRAPMNYLQLSYDLTFLSAPAGLSAASLWLYVTGGSAGTHELTAFDVTGQAAPCTANSPCKKVRPLLTA